jgi:hypothetical protein
MNQEDRTETQDMSTAITNATNINNTTDWRKLVEEHARHLEAGARLVRILALAEDEIDAVRVASDLMTAVSHCDRVRVAREYGRPLPKSPAPVSRLLTGFADQVREKLVAVVALLPETYRDRLRAIAPAVQLAIDSQEDDVVEAIVKFLPASPEVIAFAIVWCIDGIEKRFAS